MGSLVLTRKLGESVQITDAENNIWRWTFVAKEGKNARFLLKVGRATAMQVFCDGEAIECFGGHIHVHQKEWNDQICETQIKMLFDLPRSVKVVRSELIK